MSRKAGALDRFGEALKEAHGEGRAAPMRAVQEFAIERREVESHSRARLSAAEPARSMCAAAALC